MALVDSGALVVQLLAEVQLPVPAHPLVPAPFPQMPELPALAPPVPHEPELPVLAQVPPEPVLLHLLPLLLPQVVVESEVPLHLQGRQSFSAAMARIFPSPEKPTYERVPRSR